MNQRTILIAEDDAICLRVLEHILQSQGHLVMSCSNGVDAVTQILLHKPDLLLLDLGLPTPDPERHARFDGFTVLDWLRRIASNVPAIVVSGRQEPGTVKRVIEAGAIGFLEKPVVPSQLVEVVRVALTRTVQGSWPKASEAAPAQSPGSAAFAAP